MVKSFSFIRQECLLCEGHLIYDYIKEFLIVPFDDIAVFIDETHTIVFGIQNIGQRINTVRQFVEVFLMRHNVIQPLGNIDNAKC